MSECVKEDSENGMKCVKRRAESIRTPLTPTLFTGSRRMMRF